MGGALLRLTERNEQKGRDRLALLSQITLFGQVLYYLMLEVF